MATLEGGAGARRIRSSTARNDALPHWLAYYNERRPHSALAGRPPISRAHNVLGQDGYPVKRGARTTWTVTVAAS